MLIRVTARTGVGAAPLSATYEFRSGDEDVSAASVFRIREVLARGLRININEAMMLFVSCVACSLKEGKASDQIQLDVSSLLSSDQVTFGTPEMLADLDFDVLSDDGVKISVREPIAVPKYRLTAARR